MNFFSLFATTALTFGIPSAHAQGLQPQAVQAEPAARPDHTPGVGQSLPLSNNSSNNVATDTHTTIAPTLPAASVGNDGTARAYLQEARDHLVATGRTGQAQQALEMAETRTLDRVIPPGEATGPSQSEMVGLISAARSALGNSDIAQTIRLIDQALKI